MTFTALITALTLYAAADEAKLLFAQGQKLYAERQYAAAVEKFEAAYRLKPHPAVTFNIARSYEALGDLPRALRSYRAYLAAQPHAADRDQVERTIAQLEQRAGSAKVALITTEPPGAEVSVDGKPRGASPATVELAPGSHSVTARRPGAEPVERAFVMPADRSIEVAIAFPKAEPPPKAEPAKKQQPAGVIAAPPARVPATRPLRRLAWLPALGGGLLLVGGGVCYGLARSSEGQLRSGAPSLDPGAAVARGRLFETLGYTLGAVGLAALATAATFFLWPSAEVRAGVVAGPEGAAAVFAGVWP